jgi:hypothetical protein
MLVLTLAAMALAAAGQPQPQNDGANAKPAKAHRTCRTEIVTGSIMNKRVCHTAQEWAAIDAANSEAARTSLDHARRSTVQTD